MAVPLDIVTRKKLILVRQLYQRALLQAETLHSDVDRIMSVIGFDLTNETTLKAVVSTLGPSKAPANDLNGLIQQADVLLAKQALPAIANKTIIRHVHDLRNDAQHKAKNLTENDVNDCRTYTRDFLKQTIFDVWAEHFESLSLVDVIKNGNVKAFLEEAKTNIMKGDHTTAVLRAIAAFDWTVDCINESIVGRLPYNAKAFVVAEDSFSGEPFISRELFKVFQEMRELLMRSIIGVSFPGYLRYKQITKAVGAVTFFEDGGHNSFLTGYTPNIKESEFVVEFATNTVLQIESLVGDINSPFKI